MFHLRGVSFITCLQGKFSLRIRGITSFKETFFSYTAIIEFGLHQTCVGDRRLYLKETLLRVQSPYHLPRCVAANSNHEL